MHCFMMLGGRLRVGSRPGECVVLDCRCNMDTATASFIGVRTRGGREWLVVDMGLLCFWGFVLSYYVSVLYSTTTFSELGKPLGLWQSNSSIGNHCNEIGHMLDAVFAHDVIGLK